MAGQGLEHFLGGSPVSVAIRLLVVSFIVGVILVMFGVEPNDIVESVTRLFRRIVDEGFADFPQFGRTILTGAIIVVPIWLIMRLIGSRKSR
ncbi:MAG TPA: DUF6460 domain-containing protein [Roseiarcus sp.]|nr:DUF6460 domain-containing protein [Roseiarcus sp.]